MVSSLTFNRRPVYATEDSRNHLRKDTVETKKAKFFSAAFLHFYALLILSKRRMRSESEKDLRFQKEGRTGGKSGVEVDAAAPCDTS
jgi:hypothetical protein